MKKVFKNVATCVLSAAALCFGSTGAMKIEPIAAQAQTYSASDLIELSGLQAEYNVSGSEKSDDLTQDTKKGIHFSSEKVGNEAEGSSVSFKNALSGLFELDFRVYTQQKATVDWNGGEPWYAHNTAEEVREIAVTLTDLDEEESFTLYIQGGTSWSPQFPSARVAYGKANENYGSGIWYAASDGKDYDDTKSTKEGGLANKEYNTSVRDTSFTNKDGLHSTVVGFDPCTKEVYAYGFKSSEKESDYGALLNRRVILDLDDTEHLAYAGTGASVLKDCSFERYSVTFTLTDVTGASEVGSQGKDERANFLIYSINGQSLGGEDGSIEESAASGLSATFTKQAKQGEAYALPKPVCRDVFGNTTDFSGWVQVLDSDGKVVLEKSAYSDGISFTPQKSGEYTVVYGGLKDASGNVRKSLSADGTYSGEEVVYRYALTAEKAWKQTGDAANLLTASGFDVTYDVSGSEEHADLIRDTQKGVLFTSKESDASAIGSSVSFNNELSGLFELNFRAFAEETDASADWWDGGKWYDRCLTEEIREIAVTITDTDANESFTVYITGGTSWNAITPSARVAYGDVGEYYGTGYWYTTSSDSSAYSSKTSKGLTSTEYNTSLFGTSFVNRARNDGGFIGGGYSTNIGFDPVTKQVYAYTYGKADEWANYKKTILDLDDEEDRKYLTMSSSGSLASVVGESFLNATFEHYKVKITLSDMTEGKTAKFIVYHLNGQSLGGEDGKLSSDSGYEYRAAQIGTRFVGMKDSFPKPVACSVLTGEKPFDGTICITDEDGNVVLAEQAYSETLSFTPKKAGKYTVSYGGMKDENDCARLQFYRGAYTGSEEKLNISFEVKENALELPSYEYVLRNMSAEIGATPQGEGLSIYLTIKKDGQIYANVDGKKIAPNYSQAFTENGEYELIYTAKNENGGSMSYSTTVEVVGMRGFVNRTDVFAVLGESCVWSKDDFAIYYCDQGLISDYTLTAQVLGENGYITVTETDGKFDLKDAFSRLGAGERIVRFVARKGKDSVSFTRTFTVSDLTAPEIEAEALGDGFIYAEEESNENNRYYVVLKGTSGVVPSATATDNSGEATLEILLKKPTDSVATTVEANSAIVFDEEGIYTIVYRSVDSFGKAKTFSYIVETKEIWLDIAVGDEIAELGDAFVPKNPVVKNVFTGENVSSFEWSVKLLLGSVETDGSASGFYPFRTGEYEIVYTVTFEGCTQEFTAKLTVRDTVAPVITVDGTYSKTAKVGDTITILQANAEDRNVCDWTASVLLDGRTNIATKDGAFTIEQAGTYVICYTATDVAGNSSTVEYTIVVAASGAMDDATGASCASCAGNMSGTALTLILPMLVCAIVLTERKRRKNQK